MATTESAINVKKNESRRVSGKASIGELGSRRTSQNKSRARMSAQHMLGLSKMKLGDKSEIAVVTTAISDRSIYTEVPMVFSARIDRKSIPKYDNTFKLEPDIPFHFVKAEKYMKRIVHSYIDDDTTYNPIDCIDYVKKISVNVKRALKGMEIPRFKYVVITSMGEVARHSMIAQTKFLWEPEYDRYALYSYQSQFLWLYVVAYALYYN